MKEIEIKSFVYVLSWLVLFIFSPMIEAQPSVLRNARVDSTVLAVTRLPDDKILIGGIFFSVGGQNRKGIARLNSNGTVDPSFPNLNPDDAVRALAIQPDGKILIGGSFVVVNGQTFGRIMRLNPDGSIDAAFQPPNIMVGGQSVLTIAVLSDGKILIGGALTNINGEPKTGIARLNSDGSLDSTFQTSLSGAGFDPLVTSIVTQPDGKILFGGSF